MPIFLHSLFSKKLTAHLFNFLHFHHIVLPLRAAAVLQHLIAQDLQLERMRVEPRTDKPEFVFRKIDVRVMERQKLQGFCFGEIAERGDAEDVEKRRGQPLFQRINFERLPRSRPQRQPPMIDHRAQVIEKRIVEFRRILKQGFEFIQTQHQTLARVSPRPDRLIEGRQVAARLVVFLDAVSRTLHRVEHGAQKIHDGLRGGIGEFYVNKPVTRLAQRFTQAGRARLVQVPFWCGDKPTKTCRCAARLRPNSFAATAAASAGTATPPCARQTPPGFESCCRW